MVRTIKHRLFSLFIPFFYYLNGYLCVKLPLYNFLNFPYFVLYLNFYFLIFTLYLTLIRFAIM
jgi:hypothetical protein